MWRDGIRCWELIEGDAQLPRSGELDRASNWAADVVRAASVPSR